MPSSAEQQTILERIAHVPNRAILGIGLASIAILSAVGMANNDKLPHPVVCPAAEEIDEAGITGGLNEVLANTEIFIGGHPGPRKEALARQMAEDVLTSMRECHETDVMRDSYVFIPIAKQKPIEQLRREYGLHYVESGAPIPDYVRLQVIDEPIVARQEGLTTYMSFTARDREQYPLYPEGSSDIGVLSVYVAQQQDYYFPAELMSTNGASAHPTHIKVGLTGERYTSGMLEDSYGRRRLLFDNSVPTELVDGDSGDRLVADRTFSQYINNQPGLLIDNQNESYGAGAAVRSAHDALHLIETITGDRLFNVPDGPQWPSEFAFGD